MRRTAIGLVVLALLSVTTSPVAAADPFPGFRAEARAERERVSPEKRIAERGETSAEIAGALTSQLAFSHAPYQAWPAGVSLINVDGTGEFALTPGGIGQGDNQPAWSPGGTMIAFIRDTTSSTTDSTSDLFLMNADGSGLRRLTNTAAAEYAPAWSPDGSRIAFASNLPGNYEIYSMNIDGTGLTRLTFTAAVEDMPTWSPSGTQIAFASNRSGNADIWVMNANGTSPVRLTSDPNVDIEPAWSPDGSAIAFSTNRTGDFEIFTMNANGSGQTNHTIAYDSWDFAPTWSPDGSQIAYYGDPFGDLDVLIIPVEGGTPTFVTTSLDDEYAPDWEPMPSFPLVDVRFSPFEADIHWVYDAGITTGCSAERYCPNDPVTREQMAVFLDRALTLPTTTTDFFTDDETSFAEGAINRVAAAGITTGCAPSQYCPGGQVTREQMAAFLDRALTLSTTTTDFFTDDEASFAEAAINRVAAAGITTGCTATTYCPAALVTRGQMAAFLHRALT